MRLGPVQGEVRGEEEACSGPSNSPFLSHRRRLDVPLPVAGHRGARAREQRTGKALGEAEEPRRSQPCLSQEVEAELKGELTSPKGLGFGAGCRNTLGPAVWKLGMRV